MAEPIEFQLRPWTLGDLDNLVKFANNYKITNNLTDQFPFPYTIENGKSFLEMAMSHEPTRIFAIDIQGIACGAIGIHPQTDIMRNNAELGYWLAEEHWGKGIMTKAILQMCKDGFDIFDIHRIYARPYGTNVGSQKALERAGFSLEAHILKNIIKNGRIEDELIYAVRRS